MANHSSPESCAIHREVYGEALTGETTGQPLSREISELGMPTLCAKAEGHTKDGDNRKPCFDPSRSQTLCMSGSLLHGSWEISSMPCGIETGQGGTEKATSHNAVIDVGEKSDRLIVPGKLPNKAKAAEAMEGRGLVKGNAQRSPAIRTQSRVIASMGLEGVHARARKDKRCRFTALLHHITPQLLVDGFYELKRNAAAGVDGTTWAEYEPQLYSRVPELHREIHTGRYKAQAVRRVHIPKADGKTRPLGVAALEDKIVQQAVVTVLSTIYEADFMGFSYGFRPGRSQHKALDALYIGLHQRRISWVLDADIKAYFDTIDHKWMMKFLAHRIGDRRMLRLIFKWLTADVLEDGIRHSSTKGIPQGAVISPLLSNIYLHYVYDLWVHRWRTQHSGDVIVVRYADDSIVGFEAEGIAGRFLKELRERLACFGLELHPDKTRLLEFGRFAAVNRAYRGVGKPEVFDFLGFTHCCGKSRRGWFEVVRLTSKVRMCKKLVAIKETLKRRCHESTHATGQWLRGVVQGYFNYFAVPGNLSRLDGFRKAVCKLWRGALMRRSQKHRLQWARFGKLIDHFIPCCRQVHPYPKERFRVMT
jgi:RNA-directed DNA polymerase